MKKLKSIAARQLKMGNHICSKQWFSKCKLLLQLAQNLPWTFAKRPCNSAYYEENGLWLYDHNRVKEMEERTLKRELLLLGKVVLGQLSSPFSPTVGIFCIQNIGHLHKVKQKKTKWA